MFVRCAPTRDRRWVALRLPMFQFDCPGGSVIYSLPVSTDARLKAASFVVSRIFQVEMVQLLLNCRYRTTLNSCLNRTRIVLKMTERSLRSCNRDFCFCAMSWSGCKWWFRQIALGFARLGREVISKDKSLVEELWKATEKGKRWAGGQKSCRWRAGKGEWSGLGVGEVGCNAGGLGKVTADCPCRGSVSKGGGDSWRLRDGRIKYGHWRIN